MARPIGVTILAILAILAGILFLILGAAGLLVTAVAGLTPEEVQLLRAVGALGVVLGIVYLVGGIGLLRLTVWGWWLAIIASFLSVVSNIVQVVINPAALVGTVFGLVLSLYILGYLYVVRGEFGSGA